MARPGVTVGDLERALAAACPREGAAPWDRNGLLVGDPAEDVYGVAFGLDVTVDNVLAAAAAGANVLVTHHPAFLEPLESVSPDASPQSAAVYHAVALGVSLLCAHTNLDTLASARQTICQSLGFAPGTPLEDATGDADHRFGALCVLDTPVPLGEIAHSAAAHYGAGVQVWGHPADLVRTVVTGTGSGGSLLSAAVSVQADLIVCGELKYHGALDAAHAGINVVELGHGSSEWPLVQLLRTALDPVLIQHEIPVVTLDPPPSAWNAERGAE